MGRMLELLKNKPDVGAPGRVAEAGPTAPRQPVAGVNDVPLLSDAEEYPYIEVGAPGKKVEGSAAVLSAPAVSSAPHPSQGVVAPSDIRKAATVELAASPAALSPSSVAPALSPVLSPALGPPPALGVVYEPWSAAARSSVRVPSEIIAYHHPQHPISRQYVELFRQMTENLVAGAPRVVLAAGTSAQAGTTTVLLNLALCGGRADSMRLLLLDGHRQRPALAKRLGLPSLPGWQEVLSGKAALEQALRTMLSPNLQILPPGNSPCTLAADVLRWLLVWLRDRYDVILIDGPPLSEPQDLPVWSAVCDDIYIVVPQQTAEQISQVVSTVAKTVGSARGFIHTKLSPV